MSLQDVELQESKKEKKKRNKITLTNRHRDEILELILGACLNCAETGGAGRTAIMYRSCLSWYQLPVYLSRLIDCGAVEEDADKRKYSITLKGKALLHRLGELLEMLEMPRANYSKRHSNYKGWNTNTT